MGDFFKRLFDSDFMPHGHCYFWQPSLIWLHVVSDGLITLAYYSIPIVFLYFLRRRPDLKARGLVLMFGGFILACGTTHLLSIWDIWHSAYRLEGVMKAITAALSVVTAIVSIRLVPVALKIASPQQLEAVNQALRREIEGRTEAEEEMHRAAEAKLVSSQDQLRAFFEAAPQGIIGVASDGRISVVNRSTEEMFGYTREELIGQRLELLLPERFRDVHVGHRNVFFAEPRMRAMGVGLELAGRRKDGSEFPIEIGLSHVSTPEGPLAFGTVSDISERRRTEASLLASEEKLRSFFEAASQAILGVTGDGSIVLVNRRTEEIFGYGREELLGKQLSLLIPEHFRDVHATDHTAYFDKPRMRPMGIGLELFGRHKDGTEFAADIGLSHVKTPEGPLAFALVNDISAQKKAAQDLEHANEALRRSNIEMEQFAHVASHDLQEPLRMVTSYLQLIERRYAERLDDDGKEFIGFAVDGAKRMKALIRDLLEFSRAGSVVANFSSVPAAFILQNALDNLKTAIQESGARITVAPLPTIVAEPILLTQVFQNLIGNAVKFHREGTPPDIQISAEQKSSEFIFAVKDNGIGIESRHLDRIFQIFERLHTPEEYAGSGIGLAITRKIVERHGGKIWVESQSGTGSTFYFSISVETAMAQAAN